MKRCAITLMLLLLPHAHTSAQNCAGMPAVNGVCIPPDSPTSPLHSTYGRNVGTGNAPLPVWADRWGALATDNSAGSLGASVGMTGKRKAQRQALEDCRSNGGKECKVDLVYFNQCAVMILGERTYHAQSAATLDEATRIGMEFCSTDNSTCHVYYSGCSPAERVR